LESNVNVDGTTKNIFGSHADWGESKLISLRLESHETHFEYFDKTRNIWGNDVERRQNRGENFLHRLVC